MLAVATAFVALFARREIPNRKGLTAPLKLAKGEVEKVHALKDDEISPASMYEQCFTTGAAKECELSGA